MKKFLAICCALCLLPGLSGCAGKGGGAAPSGQAKGEQTVYSVSPLLELEESAGLYRSLSKPLAAGDWVYTVLGESDGAAFTGHNGVLYRVPLSGGAPETLGRIPEDLDTQLCAAGPQGDLWFYGRSAPTLTRLDGSGQTLAVYDLGNLDLPDPTDLFLGPDGTAYLACFGAGQSLAAVALEGGPHLLWSRELDRSFALGLYSFALCADGSPAALTETERGSALTIFDKSTGETLQALELDGTVYDGVLSGAGDAALYLRAGGQIFSLDPETGATAEALDLGLAGLWLYTPLCPLPDGSFAALESGGNSAVSLLRTVREALPPGGAVLTLALSGPEGSRDRELLQTAAGRWNRSHREIKVRLLDYGLYSTSADPQGGSLRLLAELTTGTVPDLYELSGLPATFVSKDRLADLGPFLEADRALDRSALLENVLEAGRAAGALKCLIPAFDLSTGAANAGFVGERQGLSPADHEALLAESPSLELLFSQTYSQSDLLDLLLRANLSFLVDWETGQARFDGELFKGLLALCARQPAQPSDSYRPGEMLASGRQLLDIRFPSLSLDEAEALLDRLGADFRFPGLPCGGGSGTAIRPLVSLGMAASSPYQEQAWQFLRAFLTGELILDSSAFSIRREQNDHLLAQALENAAASSHGPQAVSAALEQILTLAERADTLAAEDAPLFELVRELTEAYFAGDRSLEDTVSDIQSRASLYLAEQLG